MTLCLHEGWEKKLIANYVAEKDASTSTQQEEDEEESTLTITSISSVEGLVTVLNNFIFVEAKLQQAFVHQTCIDSYLYNVSAFHDSPQTCTRILKLCAYI